MTHLSVRRIFAISCVLIFTAVLFWARAFADESIYVSATAPPHASDFQFAFSSTDGISTARQYQTLSYEITYGATTSANMNTNITLVADFSQDLAPNHSDVLDYVDGSASDGYGNSPPVV